MKQITVYRTYSCGGMEGRDREVRTFETIELAKENALKDTWNNSFRLYKVVITFNGVVTETEKYLAELVYDEDTDEEYWTK